MTEARRAYNRTYYAAHREKMCEDNRDYYYAHREEDSARRRAYNAAHREKRQEYNRAYCVAHREDIRRYRATRREKYREHDRRYRAAHPEKRKEAHRRWIAMNPSYSSWNKMLIRCIDPADRNYHRYGGRGITVDLRWYTYTAFLEDMGDRPVGHHLHRLDSDVDYTKANCVWLSASEHNRLHSALRKKDETKGGGDE